MEPAAGDPSTPPVQYWFEQLRQAHGLNALVDNHRFAVLQMCFGFHAIILGAVVFGAKDSDVQNTSSWFAIAIGSGVLIVGVSLCGVFFSHHIYMRRIYKRWIAALEERLMEETGLIDNSDIVDPGHRGSLYHDDNSPHVPFERTLVLILVSLTMLNIGVPMLAARTLGATNSHVLALGFVAVPCMR